MNQNLMLAILAMDAYDRTDGCATVSLGMTNNSAIGNAELSINKADEASGFPRLPSSRQGEHIGGD
jgi:hypothetical protein